MFTADELDVVERRKLSLMADEKEDVLLNIPEDRLARTRDAAPGLLSSPEYWLRWYKETLAAFEVAKRDNRDFRTIKEDENASPGVASVLDPKGCERFTCDVGVTSSPWSVGPDRPTTSDETIVRENIVASLCSEISTTIASVGNLAPAKTGRLLPS
ncbi:unnamed protein product [Phytophthora fragariaefolia]|uniref:Unnamed protein product n=1 Tax=Phytophthora fragariaefolia TaxID=1490495 RepID=A0A9W6X003_9STRA|nr:unnamed protein product [Phytophthora fragariaefolia]